jgi:hypothetical protein
MPEEIFEIIKLSSYLKIYSVISNNENLKLGQTSDREIYNLLASEIVETEVIRKIYDVIKTKTFRYNLTDKFMWEYIKNVQGKDIGIHVIEIFNFIMNHILILCEDDKNPITYFVGVIDESVKWFLRSVYKGSIVYDDSISTEDIQGINTDNLKTYSYNDTLGRLKGIAYEKIYELLQRQAMSIDETEMLSRATSVEVDEQDYQLHDSDEEDDTVSTHDLDQTLLARHDMTRSHFSKQIERAEQHANMHAIAMTRAAEGAIEKPLPCGEGITITIHAQHTRARTSAQAHAPGPARRRSPSRPRRPRRVRRSRQLRL